MSPWRNRFRKFRKLLGLCRTPAYLRGMFHGTAAAIEHKEVLSSLKLATIIDIGANRGQFSLVARQCHPSAALYAFEPLPGPARTYRRLFAGEPGVHLFEAAVGPRAGRDEIYLTRKDDNSSLLKPTQRQVRMHPQSEVIGRVPVAVETLDSCLSSSQIVSPCLLKLDVQGYELEALEGCVTYLQQIDVIYLEVSHVSLYEDQVLAPHLVEWLANHGFSPRRSLNAMRDPDGTVLQCDMLFERNEGSKIKSNS